MKVVYVRRDFYPRVMGRLRRLLPDYRVVVFDKGDARIVIADGKRFLKDERALMALRQLEENIFGGQGGWNHNQRRCLFRND